MARILCRKHLLLIGVTLMSLGMGGCGSGDGASGGVSDTNSGSDVDIVDTNNTDGTSGSDGVSSTDGSSSIDGSSGSDGTSGNVPSNDSSMALGVPIVVDQFGYLTSQSKVAVIRDPQVGFDADDSFDPGAEYEVVNVLTNEVVFSGSPVVWNNGATDLSSGDKAWHFDFSGVTTQGDYFIRDRQRDTTSVTFRIADDVYAPVLRAAVRYFYYQRAGQIKLATHAGAGWADGASHIGPLQDKNARLYSSPDDESTERDLSGGWYDAGDLHKYTSWAAGYVIDLLHAYMENPSAWGDDYNIPESGNGVPDILDEAKWGLDWLSRMQESNGSVLSILGVSSASPPSSASGPSLYGPANTSATLAAAGAYALGAKTFGQIQGYEVFANGLRTRAEDAWAWAEANPSVLFYNNDSSNGSQGIGAGQQETDDAGRAKLKLISAIYLYDLTLSPTYGAFIDANYNQAHLIQWTYVTPFEPLIHQALLYYASLSAATPATAKALNDTYVVAMDRDGNWPEVTKKTDPYMAFLSPYVWGSNATKAHAGNLFGYLVEYDLGTRSPEDNMMAAANYLHYLHGVNPLGKVYLTNMGALGAENSVDQIFHTWFSDGSHLWDSVKNSVYGPAPGFLVGGPNPGQYSWDDRCPGISPLCGSAPPSPPLGQPDQKAYKDFNDGWPLNSWPIAENSNGYQTGYIRLLGRFVNVAR